MPIRQDKDATYLLPYDFRDVRSIADQPQDSPPPLRPGEYLVKVQRVAILQTADRPERVLFVSQVLEGPGKSREFIGRELYDIISTSMLGAPHFLQLFYACFGRRSTRWRMTHYKGRMDPTKVIGRTYLATIDWRGGYQVIVDRRDPKSA